MARIALRLLGVLAAALCSACANLVFQVDASLEPSDPILVRPGTTASYRGEISIPLPEFRLESDVSLRLDIALPDSKSAAIELASTFKGLEVRILPAAYRSLAEAPQLEDALHKALSAHRGKLKLHAYGGIDVSVALALTLAERLPRATSNTWADLYDFDPNLRSLALAPGMRLRLEGVLPVTADSDRPADQRSQGSITAPSYLYLYPAGDGAGASITLSPTLEQIGLRAESDCKYECPRWNDASGLSNLVGNEKEWRYWTVMYPQALGPVRSVQGSLQFVNEELVPRDGAPAVLLIAAYKAKDMSDFIAAAKKRLRNVDPHKARLLKDQTKNWRDAVRERNVSANLAGLPLETLVQFHARKFEPDAPVQKAALAAFRKERAAYAIRQRTADDTALDCSLLTPVNVRCFVLRYRVLPVPEILVVLQGTQRWVELGTTVGMALAPHEPIRAGSLFTGVHGVEAEKWRNRHARLPLRQLEFHRWYESARVPVRVQPDSPADAIRKIILQPGDEIQWSN